MNAANQSNSEVNNMNNQTQWQRTIRKEDAKMLSTDDRIDISFIHARKCGCGAGSTHHRPYPFRAYVA